MLALRYYYLCDLHVCFITGKGGQQKKEMEKQTGYVAGSAVILGLTVICLAALAA